MSAKQESVSEATFKAWPFSSDFSFACKDGQVVAATCKYCPLVTIEKFESEMVRRNSRGKISESAKKYRKEVYYIHRPALARHSGDGKSLHKWCKKHNLNSNYQEFHPSRVTNAPQPLLNQQFIERSVSANSISYYQKLFRTALYLVEEELVFTKLQGLAELQMRNGLKFGSADKLNDKLAVR